MYITLPSSLRIAIISSCFLSTAQVSATVLSPEDYLSLVGSPGPVGSWNLEPDSLTGSSWNLNQSSTNGDSPLGSIDAPHYKSYLPDRRRQTTSPWGDRTTTNSDPSVPPNTGVVRSYNFTIAQSTLAPDGVQRSVMLINGQFPGPTIEANWGDTIQVTVNNQLGTEGTSLHWHGMLQTNSNDQDGVPGVTQCPIAPGQTYTYSFQASSYGSTWYHAHYSAQYTAGLYGAIVVHGPTDNAPYDIDLGPVLLSDYYYQDYYSIVKEVMGTDTSKISPASDNNLINGKGSTNCVGVTAPCTPNAGLAEFQFETGKIHRLRLINAGAEAIQKFSIDNHVLTVMSVDFVPVIPYQATVITLAVGQRMDVLVTANGQTTDSVYLRSTISSCSRFNQPNALALVYYPQADKTVVPTSTAQVDSTDSCAEDPIANVVPAFISAPSTQIDRSYEIDITVNRNATGNFLWAINNSTFRADYNQPTLELLQAGATVSSLPADSNVVDFGSAKSIQLVINNLSPVAHPMHLHGYDMSVLAAGGTAPVSTAAQVAWDGSTVNPGNPMRRDTFLLQPNGFMVIQINAINPGVWPLHCHIAWHVSGGLYLNILTQTSSIQPGSGNSLCATWNSFTGAVIPDQIDSGLRL